MSEGQPECWRFAASVVVANAELFVDRSHGWRKMQLKTYRANSMADALAEVKKDLGSEAVILHTRTFKSGGVAGIGAKSVVEITASGTPLAGKADRKVQAGSAQAVRGQGVALEEPPKQVFPEIRERSERSISSSAKTVKKPREVFVPFVPPKLEDAEQAAAVAASGTASGTVASTRVHFQPVDDRAKLAIEQELSSIKRLVGQVLQATRHQSSDASNASKAVGTIGLGGLPDPLFDCYVKLMESGVNPELLEQLVGQVRDELSPAELANRELVFSSLVRRIASRIAVAAPISTQAPVAGAPQVVALVGPTGVGKTTTIAKLAATLKLRHGRKVGLVTADTYRIAAIDQLRVYANIIGISIKVAMTPGEIRGCVNECEGCDLVLVDTAGRSHNDTARLKELSEFLNSANATTRLMVLSASSAESVMKRAMEKFGVMEPTGLILTKLDEAVTLGPVLNLLDTSRVPVAYVTTGQEVPDQIEVANADRLARAVLAGELSS